MVPEGISSFKTSDEEQGRTEHISERVFHEEFVVVIDVRGQGPGGTCYTWHVPDLQAHKHISSLSGQLAFRKYSADLH
jgi:hypothetical protein